MSEPMKPMEIEQRSFEIITELLGDRVLDPENELVIKRVIHTTADFDYADNLTFSDHAVRKGIAALRAAATLSPTRRWRKLASTRRSSRASAARCIASCPTPMSRRRRDRAA